MDTQQAFTRGHLTLVHSAPALRAAPEETCNLTSRDMLTLQMWMRQPERHGYGRMVIEAGNGSGAPEEGGYALLYEPMQDWASWGVTRDGDALVSWHCGSGADAGRFPSMQAALDSLPVIWRGISRIRETAVCRGERLTVVRQA